MTKTWSMGGTPFETSTTEAHWNKAYRSKPVNQLGWYEKEANPSLHLIELTGLDENSRIFIAGAGTTTLVKSLLQKNFSEIIVNDISPEAIDLLRTDLDTDTRFKVSYIVDDLTNPYQLRTLAPVDIWHDRAVLHFFTEPNEQYNYTGLLKQLVRPGGFVILGEFSMEGVDKCSGLEVCRYDVNMMKELLGQEFMLLHTFDHLYLQPSGGERPYLYALFQRKTGQS